MSIMWQSIVTTIGKEFPKAEHRHCARHIFVNWHKTFKGDDLKILFWNCAKAYSEADFKDALDDLRKEDSRAADAFIRCKPELFCRAYIKTTTKNDVIVNNMAETFNSYIINARSKHIIDCLEEIRTNLMQRVLQKKTSMENSKDIICPRMAERLGKEKARAAECSVFLSTSTQFQVSRAMENFKVNLIDRSCSCRKWDLTGIPCCHAVAGMFHYGLIAENYVDDLYKREAYLLSYDLPIPAVPSHRYWPKVDFTVIPPPIKVGPGRPRKKRRRDPHEDPKKPEKVSRHRLYMSCSLCKSTEHNKRRCPRNNVNVRET